MLAHEAAGCLPRDTAISDGLPSITAVQVEQDGIGHARIINAFFSPEKSHQRLFLTPPVPASYGPLVVD